MIKKIGIWGLASSLLLAFSIAQAEVKVLKSDGDAWVEGPKGQRPASANERVAQRETVRTGTNGRAVVDMNGDVVVLGNQAKIVVEEGGWLHQLAGKIYYSFRKLLGGAEARQVKTPVATIGIRGTRFLVDSAEVSTQVAMEEGRVAVEPLQGEFKLFKQKEMDEFAAYQAQMRQGMQDMKDEFEQYKKQQQREFVAYVSSLSLEEGKMVSISGAEATEADVGEELEREIDDLRGFAEDIFMMPDYDGL